MKQLLFSLLISMFVAASQAQAQTPSYNETSFYVVAHQDDWQLFMGRNAYNDIANPNGKTVFIYITSGSNGTDGQCYSNSYYLAREAGAMASVQLVADQKVCGPNNPTCANVSGCPEPLATPVLQTYTVQSKDLYNMTRSVTRNHQVARLAHRNTVSYFLRIPETTLPYNGTMPPTDGANILGAFRDSNYHNYLSSNNITLMPVGQSPSSTNAPYDSWDDVVQTVKQIISAEKTGACFLNVAEINNINSSDPNISYHAWEDHFLHVLSARIGTEAATGLLNNVSWFQGYPISDKAVNLSAEDIIRKAGLYAAYNVQKVAHGASSDWVWDSGKRDNTWTAREYYRTTTLSRPATGSTLASPAVISQSLVAVYPNPFWEELTISMANTPTESVEVYLYNFTGQLVSKNYTLKPGQKSATIPMQSLPAGHYVCKIKSGAHTLRVLHISHKRDI